MATVRIGREESATSELRDGKVIKKYTQPVIVELDDDDPPYSAAEILYLAGVPRPGVTTYRPRPGVIIPFAICKSVRPKSKSRKLWELTVEYEQGGDDEPIEEDEDPESYLDLSPKFEPFTDRTEIPLVKDWDNKDIVDPLGDLFETPTMAAVPLAGVRVTRYVAGYDENTLASWECCTNSEPWRGQPADAWFIKSVTGRAVDVGGFALGQLTFEIVSSPLELTIDGSTRRVGWLEVKALQSEDFKDGTGKRVTNRNAVGTIRKTKINKDGEKATETIYAVFRKYRQRNFSAIA